MDDGTKLKPWGAPPIKGLFAIAFEVELGTEVSKPGVTFELMGGDFNKGFVDDRLNVATMPGGDQAYKLVYRNHTLVTFIPHNDLFRVTYENVGLADANKVRGFLVIEISVGTLTQKIVNADFPAGTDVNQIDQKLERQVFEKAEGHYMFTVLQTMASDLSTTFPRTAVTGSGSSS